MSGKVSSGNHRSFRWRRRIEDLFSKDVEDPDLYHAVLHSAGDGPQLNFKGPTTNCRTSDGSAAFLA